MEIGTGQSERAGLVDEGGEVVGGEGLAAAVQNPVTGPRFDEHAQATAFREDPAVHQQLQALAGGRRIDGVEGRQFIRRRRTVALGEGTVDDGVLDKVGDLPEQRRGGLVHARPSRRVLVASW